MLICCEAGFKSVDSVVLENDKRLLETKRCFSQPRGSDFSQNLKEMKTKKKDNQRHYRAIDAASSDIDAVPSDEYSAVRSEDAALSLVASCSFSSAAPAILNLYYSRDRVRDQISDGPCGYWTRSETNIHDSFVMEPIISSLRLGNSLNPGYIYCRHPSQFINLEKLYILN